MITYSCEATSTRHRMLFYLGKWKDYIAEIYMLLTMHFSRSCVIDENVQIGSGTIIGENSRVANSVIGKNCIIGDNVLLEGAYIWDNVTISNNCVISKSIIASGASIRENSSIQVGCLVSPEVTVGPEEHIPKYSRLSLHPQPKNSMFADDSDDEEEASGKLCMPRTIYWQVSNLFDDRTRYRAQVRFTSGYIFLDRMHQRRRRCGHSKCKDRNTR